jgi:uncharacterized membrane protein
MGMNKILVIVFDNEKQARQGHQALTDLHEEGAVTIHDSDVITKKAHGQVNVEEPVPHSLLWYGLSPIMAGFVGMLGGALGIPFGVGPVVAAAGALHGVIYGSFVSSMIYFQKMGEHEDFLNEVASFVEKDKAAVIADVDEHQILLTDARMEALGGAVFRQPYSDAYYVLLERDLAIVKAEIVALRSEHDQTTDDEDRLKLRIQIKSKEAKLQAMIEQAVALEEATQRIGEAKVKSLTEQGTKARGWWVSALQERIRQVQDEYDERLSKLRQARQAAQEYETDEEAEQQVW